MTSSRRRPRRTRPIVPPARDLEPADVIQCDEGRRWRVDLVCRYCEPFYDGPGNLDEDNPGPRFFPTEAEAVAWAEDQAECYRWVISDTLLGKTCCSGGVL